MTQIQPTEEQNFIYDHWVSSGLAPRGFLNNGANANAIVDELIRQGISIITFEVLTKIVRDLGDRIEYESSPHAPAPAANPKVVKEGWKRNPRPAAVVDVSDERQRFADAVNSNSGPLFEKLQRESKLEVEALLHSAVFQNSRTGRIDHGLTAERRQALHNIQVLDEKRNVLWGPTLQKVTAALRQFEQDDNRRARTSLTKSATTSTDAFGRS